MSLPSLLDIYNILLDFHGEQNWWPIVKNGVSLYLPEYATRERTPEEILEIWIGAILTQNTAWKNVEKAITNLKTHIALSPSEILHYPQNELAELIRPAGYYTQKAKKLHASMHFIENTLSGNILRLKTFPLAQARTHLLSLWGIGPETADSILLYGYRFPTFVIDAYTRRILLSLGFSEAALSYHEFQAYFQKTLPSDAHLYEEYHALFVAQGKHCKTKEGCIHCPLSPWCTTHKR